jgi:C4-dicarboxylate transporter DctM subunit
VARQPFVWRVVRRTALDAILALIMPAIILGGMFVGAYTPTEGAAVAVAYAFLIGALVYRTLTPALVYRCLRESARATGAVLFVVAMANAVSWILSMERAGLMLRQLFVPFEATPTLMLLVIAGITLLLGTAMEETTMLVRMTPVLAPVVASAGIDPVHFGLVFVFATMIGLITPPVGITMFISCQIAGVSVNEFTRAVWRPLLALIAALVVVALWPGLVLFLPNLVFGD